jgi:uncharacterized membrane protein
VGILDIPRQLLNVLWWLVVPVAVLLIVTLLIQMCGAAVAVLVVTEPRQVSK